MNVRVKLGIAVALGSMLAAGSAQASLVTLASAILPPQKIVDFSQFSGGFTFGAGPTQIGGLVGEDIVFTTSSSNSVIGDGGYGLSGNGSWNSGRNGYTGLNTGTGTMTFTFNSGLVSGVGGLLNYAPGSGPDVLIEALASDNSVLESYNINTLAPISTPNQTNAGAFRGIVRATADIKALRVTNSFVVLDDLTFTRTVGQAVPEPGPLALLMGGGVSASLFAWRRRRLAR